MNTQPQRPDLARDLINRAQQAREYHAERVRWRPGSFEADLGRHLDHANALVLQRITAAHGWPGKSLVGEESAEAAWRIALHADQFPDIQQTLLRMLATAVEQGEAPLGRWAHLYDRCAVNRGELQLYGTQYGLGIGTVELLPTMDPERLDARRASVGLPPHTSARRALQRRQFDPQTAPVEPRERSTGPRLPAAASS